MKIEFLRARVERYLADLQASKGWFWIAYTAECGFLGVVIVEGRSAENAVDRAKQLRLDPGGSVIAYPIVGAVPPEHFRNRLLGESEAREADVALQRLAHV